MSFKAFSGISIGSSHEASGKPCEDSFRISHSPDNKWTSAVVSDGCGSATKAREGSTFISEFIAEGLTSFAPLLDTRGPGDWLIDRSVLLIANLREAMREKFNSPLTDYSATIVAAFVSEAGGFILHIGDGIASTLSHDKEAGILGLKLVAQSDPENGEYVNQTFYVTEQNWIRHVRITPVTNVDCLVLCSDGAQEIFYEGNNIHGPAIVPLLQGISTSKDINDDYLARNLKTPDADKISSDDKTIIILALPTFLKKLSHINNTEIAGLTLVPEPEISHVLSPQINKMPEGKGSGSPKVFESLDDRTFLTFRQAKQVCIYCALILAAIIFTVGMMHLWDLFGTYFTDDPSETAPPSIGLSDKLKEKIIVTHPLETHKPGSSITIDNIPIPIEDIEKDPKNSEIDMEENTNPPGSNN
jgi:hypothetical protein